jgi:hypothetical protein
VKIKSKQEIEQKANEILNSYYNNGEISLPIDIESIIETELKLRLYIEPGLTNQFTGEAYLTIDAKRISVDEDLFSNNRRRSRLNFSLAHEIGHYVLHRDLFSMVNSVEDYLKEIKKVDDKTYEIIEKEADIFAGFFLMPRIVLDAYIESLDKPLDKWELQDTAKMIKYLTKIVPCSATTASIQCKYYAVTAEYPVIKGHLQSIIDMHKPR